MRRKIIFCISMILATSLCACSKNINSNEKIYNDLQPQEIGIRDESSGNDYKNIVKPELTQIRSICELATLDSYYRNVAKNIKEKGTGLSHIGEKEREFWMEYTSRVKIGIDMSKVSMRIDEDSVYISIPNAEVLSNEVDEFNENEYIASDDSWINKNEITIEKQQEAISNAEEQMIEYIENNSSMLINAQDRAKSLIENYIDQLGEVSGIDYVIYWEYIDE